MSTTTIHAGSEFFLAKKDVGRALAALKKVVAEHETPEDLARDPKAFEAATSLADALKIAGLEATLEGGDVVGLRWLGGPLPHTSRALATLLGAMAPWVKKQSYLTMVDGTEPIFIVFNGKTAKVPIGEPRRDVVGRWRKAQTCHGRKRYEQAVRLYSEFMVLATAFPNDQDMRELIVDDAWDARNIGLAKLGRWEELAHILSTAPEEHAGSASGLLYNLRREDPEGFETLARRVLELVPNHRAALEELAERCFYDTPRPAEALAFARGWLAQDPESTRAQTLLGSVHFALGQWAEARPLFEAVGAQSELANCLDMLGEGARANEVRKAAVERWKDEYRESDWAPQLAQIAEVLVELGEPEAALTFLERGATMRGADKAYFVGVLGRTQLAVGRVDEAVSSLEKALELSPNWELAMVELARALTLQGGDKKRVRALQKKASASCAFAASRVAAVSR
ncbi:MAG: hypothetical protein U0271_11200 [Polyangiaceae bacterium]